MDIHWGGIIMWATITFFAVFFGGALFMMFWSNWHTKTGIVFWVITAVLMFSIGCEYDGNGQPKHQPTPSPSPIQKVECINVGGQS